jgi:hypothetical protein
MLARRVLGRGLSTSTNQLAGLSRSLQLGAPIDVHPEVEHALQNHLPVVALESTIITHGMPYLTNLTTARSVENIVRSTGAIPATIGLVSGRIKIGLTSHELERLADVDQNKGVKLSRRDLGPAIAAKRDGGTTCSTTLIFAALAGIKVRSSLIHFGHVSYGTPGLLDGRVSSRLQRRSQIYLSRILSDWEVSIVVANPVSTAFLYLFLAIFFLTTSFAAMDVSADLHELTRCPVGLVSAGVKSILDIGRTLEYLVWILHIRVLPVAEVSFDVGNTRCTGGYLWLD